MPIGQLGDCTRKGRKTSKAPLGQKSSGGRVQPNSAGGLCIRCYASEWPQSKTNDWDFYTPHPIVMGEGLLGDGERAISSLSSSLLFV